MNSDKKNEAQFLARISPAKAKGFLLELANLRKDSIQRFLGKFEKMLPSKFMEEIGESLSKQKQFKEELFPKLLPEERQWEKEEGYKYTKEDWPSYNILRLRNVVRQIWIEKDLRTKKYGVFLLWKWAMFPGMLDSVELYPPSMPTELPPPNAFEQSLQYMLDEVDLAHHCENPECLTPYFFAKRRSQKYCSDACAIPAQRESKRQWWAEHGGQWRATRRETPKGVVSKKQKRRK